MSTTSPTQYSTVFASIGRASNILPPALLIRDLNSLLTLTHLLRVSCSRTGPRSEGIDCPVQPAEKLPAPALARGVLEDLDVHYPLEAYTV